MLRTLATNTDFSVDLSGEVSEGGRRGMTPFGPFPMQFPPASGNRMAELLISDFTVNSLLYQMHKYADITVDSKLSKRFFSEKISSLSLLDRKRLQSDSY